MRCNLNRQFPSLVDGIFIRARLPSSKMSCIGITARYAKLRIVNNIIAFAKNNGVPVFCCGEKMTEIVPGTTDAAIEKHVPVISQQGNIVTVTVGSVEHPMIPEHFIEWISLETNKGNQRKLLKPNTAPKAQFALLNGEEVVAAYAYCNLHSLWKS